MQRAPTWMPIAIIGVAVRKSEVTTPSALLSMLRAEQWPTLGSVVSPVGDLFEVAFDAIEDAGVPLDRAQKRSVGVFASARASEGSPSGSISQRLGIHGPLADTTEGSLTAVYLACQALVDGTCDLALAVGDSGYERGIVVLERLDRALSDRHAVLAVVRATGRVEQRSIQQAEASIRSILAASGTEPAEVGYLEVQDDPAWLAPYSAVYGRGEQPLHTCFVSHDAACEGRIDGVVSLIRAALAVRHREVYRAPLARDLLVDLVSQHRTLVSAVHRASWPVPRRALAALTARGVEGSAYHAVIAQADPDLPPPSLSDPPEVWVVPVSALDPEALARRADDLSQRLALGVNPMDIAYSCAHHRSHLPVRAVVVSATLPGMTKALAALAAGETHPCLVSASERPGKTAWLFSDAPERWPGAGATLCREESSFRNAFDEAYEMLVAHDALQGGDVFALQTSTREVSIPANFALQVGLVSWLRAVGHEPSAIIAVGSGEFAAAWACGVRTLATCAAASANARDRSADWPEGATRAPSVPFWYAPSGDDARLAAVLADAASLGITTAVLLGPPSPAPPASAHPIDLVSMLEPQVSEVCSARIAAAALYVHGATLDWSRLVRTGTRIALGAYPWG